MSRVARYVTPAAALITALLTIAIPARADEQQLQQRVDHLEQELKIRDRIIRNLLDRVNVLEDQQAKEQQPPRSGVPERSPATRPATSPPSATPQETAVAATQLPAPPQDRLAQLRASAAFERTLIQRGGLLLPPHVWELEPAISYSHSSSDRVVIDGFTVQQVLVVGDIFNERVDRDIYQLALTTRIGLPGDSQVELRIPYARVSEGVFNAQNEESSSDATSLGDIELAYSHQFVRGEGTRPSFLGTLRWKSATGDDPFEVSQHTATFGAGYDSVQATVTAIQTSDPVVFYGGLSYTANLATSKPIGRIEPGDSYGFQAGLALSLNIDTSLSIGWEQRYTRHTKVDGQSIPGSYLNSGSLSFGVSHTTFSGRTYDINANIGLTRDTPDAQFSVAIPLRL